MGKHEPRKTLNRCVCLCGKTLFPPPPLPYQGKEKQLSLPPGTKIEPGTLSYWLDYSTRHDYESFNSNSRQNVRVVRWWLKRQLSWVSLAPLNKIDDKFIKCLISITCYECKCYIQTPCQCSKSSAFLALHCSFWYATLHEVELTSLQPYLEVL